MGREVSNKHLYKETTSLTGQDESVHLDMHEQWKEWLQIVVRMPLVSWSSLSVNIEKIKSKDSYLNIMQVMKIIWAEQWREPKTSKLN